jgi:hypothetical protein
LIPAPNWGGNSDGAASIPTTCSRTVTGGPFWAASASRIQLPTASRCCCAPA